MEIHKPRRPVHSLREFAVELVTITIGVLIALSLEGIVNWHANRVLVQEAKETMAREIADNMTELNAELSAIDGHQRNLGDAITMADDLLAKRPRSINQLSLGFELADLSEAGWQSAERTGALAHMPYADVQQYASLYGLQELFVEEQHQVLDKLTAALAIFAGGADPTEAAPRDLEAFREAAMSLRSELSVHKQLGERLAARYRKALGT